MLRESKPQRAQKRSFSQKNNRTEYDECCSEVVLSIVEEPELWECDFAAVPDFSNAGYHICNYMEQNKPIREGMHDSTLRALEEGEKRHKEIY